MGVGTFGGVSLRVDQRTCESSSAEQTEEAGARLAARLRPGDVVILRGELGSGKTVFVRGAAAALGFRGRVTSPTFAIGNIYPGSDAEIAHLDLYRLHQLECSDEAATNDFLTPERFGFVEWPHDQLAELPRLRAVVSLQHAGGDDRSIAIEWFEQR
jgi:tRNA threonylcarbamoyladenosine biosynthesis protein TsaE